MKFRKYPYGTILLNIGIIFYSLFTILAVLGAIFLPNGRTELIIISCIGCLGAGLLLMCTQRTHGWIYVDNIGIRQRSPFGYMNAIRWEECVDIGIVRGDRGSLSGNGMHIWVPWLYFSRVWLTHEQLYNTRKIGKLQGNKDVIMVRCRQEILDEVQKYTDKEKIRNLHLFKN